MATSLLQGHSSDSTSTMKPAAEHYPPAGSDMEGGFQSGQPVYSHSAAIKAGFLRKVYGILSIQLLFTCCSSAFFMFHEPTRNYVLANPSMLMAASIAPFGFLLALFCYKDRHPLNMALLGGFTVCMTYTVGVVCAAYYQNHMGVIVLQALILTASVFISLTTYVLVTKKDFSFLGGGLFAGLMILIVWCAAAHPLSLPSRRPTHLRAASGRPHPRPPPICLWCCSQGLPQLLLRLWPGRPHGLLPRRRAALRRLHSLRHLAHHPPSGA